MPTETVDRMPDVFFQIPWIRVRANRLTAILIDTLGRMMRGQKSRAFAVAVLLDSIHKSGDTYLARRQPGVNKDVGYSREVD